jgi:ribosomal protein S12
MKWLTGKEDEVTAYEVTMPNGRRVVDSIPGPHAHDPECTVREVTGIRHTHGFEVTGYLD